MGKGLRYGALGLAALVAAGCGGGERQDANEPKGTFSVELVDATFPESQHIAKQSTMRIRVRNPGDRSIPNVAVTVKGFDRSDPQPGLADPNKPVWIVDRGPKGGDTAYVGTWALGRLAPGSSKTFEWRVTPTRPGNYEVSYRLAAGLDGKAKVSSEGGKPTSGSFDVKVSGEAPQATVDPETGEVIREEDSGQ